MKLIKIFKVCLPTIFKMEPLVSFIAGGEHIETLGDGPFGSRMADRD